MPVEKHSVEQIIARLREIEKLTAQGLSVPIAAKKVGITDQTFYRWWIRYGALKEKEAKGLQLQDSCSATQAISHYVGANLRASRMSHET